MPRCSPCAVSSSSSTVSPQSPCTLLPCFSALASSSALCFAAIDCRIAISMFCFSALLISVCFSVVSLMVSFILSMVSRSGVTMSPSCSLLESANSFCRSFSMSLVAFFICSVMRLSVSLNLLSWLSSTFSHASSLSFSALSSCRCASFFASLSRFFPSSLASASCRWLSVFASLSCRCASFLASASCCCSMSFCVCSACCLPFWPIMPINVPATMPASSAVMPIISSIEWWCYVSLIVLWSMGSCRNSKPFLLTKLHIIIVKTELSCHDFYCLWR